MAPYFDEYDLTVSDIGSGSASVKQNLAVKRNPQKHSIFRSKYFTTSRSPKRHSMKTINIGLLISALFTCFFGICYLLFNPLVRHITLKQLVLRNNSEFAKIWENPPITPHLKVYFFNLTNPDAVFAGNEQPNLTEVGPYVYHQKWVKEDVRWHNNGTMSYRTKKSFHFQPKLSVGDHSKDLISTLNVPAISAYYQLRHKSWWEYYGPDWAISSMHGKMWVQKTPEELIWGYHEGLFDLAELGGFTNIPPNGVFGFFTKKNDTANLPLYTMFTGEGNPYNLSKISLVNGKNLLNFWGGKAPEDKVNQCNTVKGSDGSTFNPYIKKEDTLWFFNDELCRSIPLVFDEEVTSVDIPGYRFIPRSDVFTTPRTTPENECFCTDEDLCDVIGDGMFAVSKCQMDAPIVLSWPHFLHANSSFLNAVDGLNPDQDKHGFYFDIQQTTGTTIAASAKIQINMAVRQMSQFDSLKDVKNTVMPILWFDEGLDELGPELREVIGSAVIDPPIYKNYILCILLGLGISTLFISVVAGIRLCLNKRNATKFSSTFDDIYCSSASLADVTYNQRKLRGFTGDLADERMLQNVKHMLNERIPQHSSIIRVKNGHGNHIEAAQRLLAGDSQLTSAATSTESSRISSASHSRNSSTGIPNNPVNSNVAISILKEGNNQQDQTIMNTVLSTFVPATKNTTQPANPMPAVSSTQALLDPETNLPNA